MEAEPGLAILTTNQKEDLDTAFLRRIVGRAIMRWVPQWCWLPISPACVPSAEKRTP